MKKRSGNNRGRVRKKEEEILCMRKCARQSQREGTLLEMKEGKQGKRNMTKEKKVREFVK